MIHGRKGRRTLRPRWPGRLQRPARPPGIKCWLPILALSVLVSRPTLAQESTGPKPEESRPVSTRPERLYTEAEALTAARTAAEAAVAAAIPLAVQAAVADERGRAAAQQVLDKAVAETFQRQARSWRSLALVTAGAGTGALADGGRGLLYGAAGGAIAAAMWWVADHWPWWKAASLSP